MKALDKGGLKLLWNRVSKADDKKINKIDAAGIATCSGNGEYSYLKIATIKITATYINRPLVFEISGRQKSLSLLTVMFSSINTTDPSLSIFRTNQENSFWIKKTATSTWEIYGQYSETWGSYALHRITGMGADIGVTVNMTNMSSMPSDCTQVTYGGNVSYANSAGSVAWDNVTNKISASASAAGLMSAADKSKLDGITFTEDAVQSAFDSVYS